MSNHKIPVSFDYKGETIKGYFQPVSGSGNPSSWHLYREGNFYFGYLFKSDDRWIFSNQEGYCTELADYFGDLVTAWYQ